ncbi:MAG: formate dehydrogenase subunit gamma [Rhodanobacteraceae bacterium]
MRSNEPSVAANPADTSVGAGSTGRVLGADARERIGAAIDRWKSSPGALLPILHAVQDSLGYIPPASIGAIAHALNLTRAEVHGVVSFYHDFCTRPRARRVLRLCRAEACQALGARRLEAHVRHTLGIDFGERTSDGAIALEPVYCLGNCACGPSLMIDDELHGRVTPERFDALIDNLGATS